MQGEGGASVLTEKLRCEVPKMRDMLQTRPGDASGEREKTSILIRRGKMGVCPGDLVVLYLIQMGFWSVLGSVGRNMYGEKRTLIIFK